MDSLDLKNTSRDPEASEDTIISSGEAKQRWEQCKADFFAKENLKKKAASASGEKKKDRNRKAASGANLVNPRRVIRPSYRPYPQPVSQSYQPRDDDLDDDNSSDDDGDDKDRGPSEAIDSLMNMIGLESIKNEFLDLYVGNNLAKERGTRALSTYNVRFEGNPGIYIFIHVQFDYNIFIIRDWKNYGCKAL